MGILPNYLYLTTINLYSWDMKKISKQSSNIDSKYIYIYIYLLMYYLQFNIKLKKMDTIYIYMEI